MEEVTTSGTLFGYSLDQQDDTLIITLRGSLVEEALRILREGVKAGGSVPMEMLLSPIISIGKLLTAPMPQGYGREGLFQPRPADVEASLSQEVDRAFAAFQEEMRAFDRSVHEFKAQKNDSASKEPKSSRRS
jgi:hypothetical protein